MDNRQADFGLQITVAASLGMTGIHSVRPRYFHYLEPNLKLFCGCRPSTAANAIKKNSGRVSGTKSR
jgi:hypothetical protein